MTFEIGQLSFQPTAAPAPAGAVWPSAGRRGRGCARLAGRQRRRDPREPAPEVLAEVDAAWERAAELAAQNRELHFAADEETGRVIIEVRTLDGEVLRTIPPSRALDVMSGAEL